jgi:tetratricopeptide (TPR) repeat protein
LFLAACSSPKPAPEVVEPKPPAEPKESDLPDPVLVPLPEVNLSEFRPAARPRIRAAREEAARSPDDAETVGRFCMLLHAHRKWPPAEQCYQRARALAPNDFRWPYYLGVAAESLGKRAEALAFTRHAVTLSPDNSPARVRLAALLLEEGDLAGSEQSVREALRLDPRLASAHYSLGRVLAAKNDWPAAVSAYRTATDLAKNYGAAHYALGLALNRIGEKQNAQAALRRFEDLKHVPQPSLDPALEAVNAVLPQKPVTAGPEATLPVSGLARAAAELERSLQSQPGLVSAHANLIGVYWELGQPAKAEEHYRAALRIDPKNVLAHYNWGLIRLLQGDLDKAEASFRKALSIRPQYADAHVQLGLALERKQQRDEAAGHYRAALQANPYHRRAHFHLGVALLRSGQPDEGLKHLHETVRIEDPQTPRFMRALARGYAEAGNRERALHYANEARRRATERGMADLLAQLDQDLKLIEGMPATQ